MFLLQCPRCKQQMKYEPTDKVILGKSKRCVYCGRTFKVREQVIKQL